jgi:beta-phosphoglucomutase-like phosphatase (HAD superfamily)
MQKIEAIIFDMNGVIIDDEHLHKQAEVITAKHFGFDVPDYEWENMRGRKSTDIFTYIVNNYGNGDVLVEEVVAYKLAQYFLLANQALLVPGVLEFIKWSRANYKYLAVGTSGLQEIQEYVFKRFELSSYFDFVITGNQAKNGKPHPEIYQLIIEHFKLPADSCIVIEDSDNGVKSGKAAGCVTFGITTTFPEEVLKLAGADMVFSDFECIKGYLAGSL